MLRFVVGNKREHGHWSRREWLRIGGLAGLGLLGAAPNSLAQEGEQRPRGFGRAKSVIILFASGGQSQIDTWDPKPNAPQEIRGAFSSIQTAIPGVAFSEHMPRLAALADRFTTVRCMSHDDLDHGSAVYLTLTGRFHKRKSSNPDPQPTDMPTLGAVLKRVRPTDRFIYDAVHLNGPAQVPIQIAPGQTGGFLGGEFDPLVLGDVVQNKTVIPGLAPLDDLPVVRLEARRSLKATLDQYAQQLSTRDDALKLSHLYRQAAQLLSDTRYREAFRLEAEKESLRDRYGRYRSGQACLLARRLVEAGAPLVTVMCNHTNRGQDLAPDDIESYGWDTHNDIFYALRENLLPRFDLTFSALLEDLDERGLLDQTLVVCLGEFGRAPKVALESNFAGKTPGRKHWAAVYSVVFAGAGVQRGAVIGASDRLGAEPATFRLSPADVAATIFSALGIPHDALYYDMIDRPYPVSVGRPIEALYTG